MSQTPSRSSTTAWYDSPLYYDMVYADYIRPETRFIQAILRKYSPKIAAPFKILEPACGSGRLLESLAKSGHQVHGFDLNRHQIAFAKKRIQDKKLKAKIWRDDLTVFKTPVGARYDCAHCLVSTFKYIVTERGAIACLRRISRALRPGGILILGLHLSDYKVKEDDHERWIGRRPGIRVVSDTWSGIPNPRTRLEACRTRMKISEKGKTRVEETFWDFRTYSPTEIKSLLSKIPDLRVVGCYDFHYDIKKTRRIDGSYSDIVIVLQKKIK